MKRTPLKRGKPLARRTRLKATNPQRVARQRKAYAAYLRSPAWKALRAEAMERAGHRCEHETATLAHTPGAAWADSFAHPGYLPTSDTVATLVRCHETERLQGHHKVRPKVLGEEPVSSIQILCHAHHQYIESTEFWWRKPRRSA